ncbi:ferredoxin reductase family protein [Isoptericola sp. b490]|uniref:ferredoxin reductase family protein n=1 Tax=Actinotalea lenta TaxID=3064654 RepID=UPI002712C67D|nr:ferredoxin reductase family protein [Isoptericola sp. b490]MDO8121883.1 ferredoxin reductase family protein [Isoptericola sp. b490]
MNPVATERAPLRGSASARRVLPEESTGRSTAPLLRLRPPMLRRWWTDAAGLVVWATMLIVVALWEQHGGVQDLAAGGASALNSIGRLSGLLSADLLLLQVLSMARVPFIERSLGQDRLTRWHRWVGFTSIWLMVVHIVFITVGYAQLDHWNVVSEAWSLITTAPGMLLATAGTALLVLVTVTSIRVARRKLRYESWHLLHLYAYLGAGLALPHQLWTGTDFLASTWATVYWWSAYGLVMALVLVYRVAVPLRLSAQQRLRVTSVQPAGPGAVTVAMHGPHLADLQVAAGQFFVFRFMTGPGWTRPHPLSLSAAPTTHGLRVTMGVTGDDGERIARMRPGTRVMIEGPYGRLHPLVRSRPQLVLMGSGLGLAPLVALAQEAVLAGRLTHGPALMIRRLRSGVDAPMQADVDRLTAAGALQVVDLVGPRSRSGTAWLPQKHGHLPGTEAVRRLVPNLASADIYVCGTGPWVEAVADDLRSAGAPKHAVHAENFTW